MEKAYLVCYLGTMDAGREALLTSLERTVTTAHKRQDALEKIRRAFPIHHKNVILSGAGSQVRASVHFYQLATGSSW